MPKAILLDIEGTTTPIDFVHKTLFPYARARMAGFVSDNFNDLKIEVAQLAEEHATEGDHNAEFRPDSANSVSEYLNFLIDNDRKSTPLKSIQGMIWQTGYESGDLVSNVYPDVPAAFKRWKDAGKTVAIYSSGSVLAQQLIFKHSDQGDLTRFIDNYFDTNVGHKREAESYRRIAEQLELQPDTILFVSDIPEELYAADEVGMRVLLSVRPGNAPVAQIDSLKPITSFDEIDI